MTPCHLTRQQYRTTPWTDDTTLHASGTTHTPYTTWQTNSIWLHQVTYMMQNRTITVQLNVKIFTFEGTPHELLLPAWDNKLLNGASWAAQACSQEKITSWATANLCVRLPIYIVHAGVRTHSTHACPSVPSAGNMHWVIKALTCPPYTATTYDKIHTTQHAFNYHKPRTVWTVCTAEVLALWRQRSCVYLWKQ